MPSSPPLGTATIKRLVRPKTDGRVADGDSAGIPPNTIQQSVTGTTFPRPGRCGTQGALLSSDDFGLRVGRIGGCHPLWRWGSESVWWWSLIDVVLYGFLREDETLTVVGWGEGAEPSAVIHVLRPSGGLW